MEIPKYWREQPTNLRFEGKFKKDKDSGRLSFKYSGGEVPVVNVYDFAERLEAKGFADEDIEKILVLFTGTVATEASIPMTKVLERVQ